MFALISSRSGSQSAMLLRWALQGHHGPLVFFFALIFPQQTFFLFFFRFLSFCKCRIPRENLLNKTGDVTPEGKYVTPYKVGFDQVILSDHLYIFLSYLTKFTNSNNVGGMDKFSGPSCSKLTMLLVNDMLKFTLSDMQICWIFMLKKCE